MLGAILTLKCSESNILYVKSVILSVQGKYSCNYSAPENVKYVLRSGTGPHMMHDVSYATIVVGENERRVLVGSEG